MPTPTFQLTQAVVRGDEEAIGRFYQAYFPWLLQVALRTTERDESFCLDVVQEAVLKVLRCVKPIESEGQFKAWLELVVQSSAYDLLKAEARRRRREEKVANARLETTSELAHELTEKLNWLKQQLARLDPDIARMIDLRYEQSWPLEKIASFLGQSIGTIDGRLRRAIQHLRKLAPEGLHD